MKWQFQSNNNDWIDYDQKISIFLNEMYNKNHYGRTIIKVYCEIDFKMMTEENLQTNEKIKIRQLSGG